MKVLRGEDAKTARKYLAKAAESSKHSKCLKRPRGVVIVKSGKVIGQGWNGPVDKHQCQKCLRDRAKEFKFSSFNTEPCYSIHAEQRAIIDAFKRGFNDLSLAKMYFARVEEGKSSPVDDAFSCTICSKIILESGLKSFIYEVKGKGIVEISAEEFNTLSFRTLEATLKSE